MAPAGAPSISFPDVFIGLESAPAPEESMLASEHDVKVNNVDTFKNNFADAAPTLTPSVSGSVAALAATANSASTSTSPSATEKAANPTITAPAPVYTCDYYKGSTVPSQAGGTFWSVLNRVFILGECLLLILSEIGFPKSLFANYIPMLGPDYGLGCLGVLQTLIASGVLSHHCGIFAQVCGWLLFMVAMANILAGIFLRDTAKGMRSLFKWENYEDL